jgi:transcriptional regulator with XRE-family HTH domain
MSVEIGQKIQEVFEKQDMKLTDFADELGTVRQNVYRIFKKRHLDTGLLLKISQVLNHNFFQYYLSDNEVQHVERAKEFERLVAENAENQRQLELARKEVDYLRKIIKLMEEKAELVQQIGKENFIVH